MFGLYITKLLTTAKLNMAATICQSVLSFTSHFRESIVLTTVAAGNTIFQIVPDDVDDTLRKNKQSR